MRFPNTNSTPTSAWPLAPEESPSLAAAHSAGTSLKSAEVYP